MNLVKSANDRAKAEALKKQYDEQYAYKVRQEAISIRISLVSINPKLAKPAWDAISLIEHPESTYYVQAYYCLLKDAEFMPKKEAVLELVSFFKNG